MFLYFAYIFQVKSMVGVAEVQTVAYGRVQVARNLHVLGR